MPTIIGSTTLSVNSAVIAASTAFPPLTSTSAAAADARGWFVTTIPPEAMTGDLSHANVVPAEARQGFSFISAVSYE
jgi:hypothetical protein